LSFICPLLDQKGAQLSYRVEVQAIEKQGQRTDLTSGQNGYNSGSCPLFVLHCH